MAWCHVASSRVGVIWAGRPTHNNDRNRSALLADFRPLADVERGRAAGVAEGTEDRPGRRVLWPRAADQHRRRDRGLRRHHGDPRQSRSAGDGRYLGRASGGRDGAAGVDHAAARAGLALAARSRGYALVSERAAVPSANLAPVGRCRAFGGGRTGDARLGDTRSASAGDRPDRVRVAADLAQHFLGMLAERRPEATHRRR